MAKPWSARQVRTKLHCTLRTSNIKTWRNPGAMRINSALLVRQLQGKHILLGDDAK